MLSFAVLSRFQTAHHVFLLGRQSCRNLKGVERLWRQLAFSHFVQLLRLHLSGEMLFIEHKDAAGTPRKRSSGVYVGAL